MLRCIARDRRLHPRDVVYAHVSGSPFAVRVASHAVGADGGRGLLHSAGSQHEKCEAVKACDWQEKDASTEAQVHGGPWAPYLRRGRLEVCSTAQSLDAKGRWVDKDRCSGRDDQGLFKGWESGCALDGLADDYSTGSKQEPSSQYTWVMRECAVLRYKELDLLRCAERRRQKKIVITGSSMQRTTFYDLVVLFDAKHVIDITFKHKGTMRFTVCYRASQQTPSQAAATHAGTASEHRQYPGNTTRRGAAAHRQGAASSGSAGERIKARHGRGSRWAVVTGISFNESRAASPAAGAGHGSQEGSHGGSFSDTCTEESVGAQVEGEGRLLALEIAFVWSMPGRDGANSSVAEYVQLATDLKNISARERLAAGDLFLVGIHPYDVFQRPLHTVDAGSRVVARALAEIGSPPGAPTIIFRNTDALHLPWLTFGQAMWGAVNGISAPRGLYVHRLYARAMQEAGVKCLDALQPSNARSDQTHDGLHYYSRHARDSLVRQGMSLYSNSVGHVVLQLVFNAACNAHVVSGRADQDSES